VEAETAFVLCADDYALTEGVSHAMLDLVDARRLTAVSAMSSMPTWRKFSADIGSRRGSVAIGLHLDLTLRPFAGKRNPYGVPSLIAKSLLRKLDASAIESEFERQFDLFEDALGFAPDHVDGHHHVHALPQVRDCLLKVLRDRYSALTESQRPLVRAPFDTIPRILARRGARSKALIVASLARHFAEAANAAGFVTNIGYAGFSRFAGKMAFDRELTEFLKSPGPRQLIMCHPGYSAPALVRLDPVAEQRQAEYLVLMERNDFKDRNLTIHRPRNRPDGAFVAWRRIAPWRLGGFANKRRSLQSGGRRGRSWAGVSMNLMSPSAQTPGAALRAGARRILIDCSLSRFDEQPTGIPRVIVNYVRHGREFGECNGVAVAPVELAANGRYRARVMAGNKPGAASSTSPLRFALILAAKIWLELLRHFSRIFIAGIALVGAILPIRAVLKATTTLSHHAPAVTPGARGRLEKRRGDFIHPGAGDVLLCPNYWHDIDPAIYEAFRTRGAEIAVVVHDILTVTLTGYYKYPWRWQFERNLARSFEYVGHYYCISHKTLLDLTAFAERRGKVITASVAYNGFDSLVAENAVVRAGAAHEEVVGRLPWLMVGTLEPKKITATFWPPSRPFGQRVIAGPWLLSAVAAGCATILSKAFKPHAGWAIVYSGSMMWPTRRWRPSTAGRTPCCSLPWQRAPDFRSSRRRVAVCRSSLGTRRRQGDPSVAWRLFRDG
jgi:predicted glycoside hydrolase/deacetylase ChbG (UPF0249 family)